MKQIKLIPQVSVISNLYPKWVKPIIYLILVCFLGVIFFVSDIFIDIYDNDNVNFKTKLNLFISLIITLVLFVFASFNLFKGGVYVPRKSFLIERINKKKLNKYVIVLASFYLIFTLWDLYSMNWRILKRIGSYIFTFIGFYYVLKSIKYHENVDYSANQSMMELFGIPIDEVITASYQNFDATKSQFSKGDFIVVVTVRRIYYAHYDGNKLYSSTKYLEEINAIGISRKLEESYLKLVFEDRSEIGIRLNVLDKTTTAPQLFIQQLINTLDALLLGFDVVSSVNRRRVTISSESTSVANDSLNQTRCIELNPTLVSEFKTSEEIKSGRILEI
jgi:hypothetical protein